MMMGGRGPDLGKVGANAVHTVEWLKGYITDPRSQKPDAKMPPQRQVKDPDLTALAEYLASLK
jgi:cbb3-type cytochrome oxidase cytochrome c subunit